MKFASMIKSIYTKLNNGSIDTNVNFEIENAVDFLKSIDKNFSWEKIKNQYLLEIDSSLKDRLSFYYEDLSKIRHKESVPQYEQSMIVFTIFLFFWLWKNNVDLSEPELDKLKEGFYIGNIGYRLLDIHIDHKYIGAEAIPLGMYMIHVYEELLMEVFNHNNAFNKINFFNEMYTKAEYLEKKNRWKDCPFNWENTQLIGYKAAPLIGIYVLAATSVRMESSNINLLINGLINIFAAIQLMNDFGDVNEDLANGIESLSVKGIYKTEGADKINKDKVEKFLTQERIENFYNKTQELFENARQIFTELDDEILLLYTEIYNYKFNSILEQAG